MNILSLFDGCAMAYCALERAGIKVDSYYASETDTYAIKIAKKNHFDIIKLGDINNFEGKGWFTASIGISEILCPDLIIAGFPCQDLSFAGKQKGLAGGRSGLFWKAVEILNYYRPKYFLFENVRMKQEYQNIISEALGVQPIMIDSALVSAQSRKRLYWTNIPGVTQPKDRGILLKDILEGTEQLGCRIVGRKINSEGKRDDYNHEILTQQYIEPRLDGKSNCLSTVAKDSLILKNETSLVWTDRDKSYCIDANYYKGASFEQYQTKCRRQLARDNGQWRKLTCVEAERLQTLPDNHTEGVSNTQRYKMLGNGFTVDVITHILSFIPKCIRGVK